jgi:leucyl aminopeptidase (aminopeptidase T)
VADGYDLQSRGQFAAVSAVSRDRSPLPRGSPKGTDLTFDKMGRKGSYQGLGASEPGRWDNFGWCLISTAPIEDSVNGVIVADTNDAILGIGDATIFLEEPTKFEIKDGLITKVSGGLTAKRITKFLADHDRETSGVAHAGWGTQTGSVWSESPMLTYADVEGFLGGVTVHFGTNIYDCPAPHCGLGGKRRADTHWGGITSLQNDFYLDGELVKKWKGDLLDDRSR